MTGETNELIPVSVINAGGFTTTVHRKPAVTSKPTKPKTVKALISEAAENLGISKAMGKRLGKKSEELPSDSQNSMLSLMSQPDPHGTVKTILVNKFGKRPPALYPEGTDPYKTPDMERFASWVIHADNHLHAIDELARQLQSPEFTYRTIDSTLAGLLVHERHGYTAEQYRDIVLITAASSINRIDNVVASINGSRQRDYNLTTAHFLSPNEHEYLSSSLLLERITADHAVAAEALRMIVVNHLLTESEVLSRLDGV